MARTASDGLARLQNQSRIPASTWRQWCGMLHLDPLDAVDVWEEVCHPIMVATRKVPEVALLLQLRAARPEVDIFDFKEEAPRFLHLLTFVAAMRDPRLAGDKLKASVLRYYRSLASDPVLARDSNAFIRRFLRDVCSAILIAKVLPVAGITLSGVLKPLTGGRGSLDQIVSLGLKALREQPFAGVVRECLTTPETAVASLAETDDEGDAGDQAEADDDDLDEDDDDFDDEEEEEEEEEEGEEDEEDEDDEGIDDDDDDEDDDLDADGDGDLPSGADAGRDSGDAGLDPFEVFLMRFRTALHAIYEHEARSAGDDEENGDDVEKLLEERLKAITLFKPMQATVPSMEEAQLTARRAEAAQTVVKLHKSSPGGARAATSASAAPASGGGGGAARSGAAKSGSEGTGSLAALDVAALATRSAGGGGRPLPLSEEVQVDGATGVEVAAADLVEPEEISLPDISERAYRIARLLPAIESLDQVVWSLVLEPGTSLKDPRALTRTLATNGTGAHNAYEAVKQIARSLPLKQLLHLSEQSIRRDRNFLIEVTSYINNLKGERTLDANSRQLNPLPRILDHCLAALLRLEALRVNGVFAREKPDRYDQESVTNYYEEALRSLTDLGAPDLRRQARERADQDTRVLLELFEAEKFVKQMLEVVRSYALAIREAGATASLDSLQAVIADRPLEFTDVVAANNSEVPAPLLVSCGMGEVYDEVCRYVVTQAWAVLQPAHQPEETAQKIRGVLRDVMTSTFVLDPEMRRHQEKARLPMAVVSLEKVTGNPKVRDYYVRLREDGHIAYLEGFEDGTYVDLFELREYTPTRVHAAAKKRAEESANEELQKGRKYLFTIGRTNSLRGENPNDLINGCIRSAEGGPKIFPLP